MAAPPSDSWTLLAAASGDDATATLGRAAEAVAPTVLLPPTRPSDPPALGEPTLIEAGSATLPASSLAATPRDAGSATVATAFHQRVGLGAFTPGVVLGRGGMGEVLLARQASLEREVAVKVVRKTDRRDERLAALRREAAIAGALEHPGIVPVHDAGDDFLVMRRLRGQTMADLLAGAPRHGEGLAEAVGWLIRICDAIAFAHSRGIVHRDLKPANLMVGEHGEVLLLDWGLALRGTWAEGRWRSDELDADSACAGTPAYLAPEMARADPAAIGPASDVYLVAAVLYEIIAGQAPHRAGGVRASVLAAAANRPPPLPAGTPERLRAAVARAMADDPSDRGSIGDLREALRAWLHRSRAESEALTALAEARVRQTEAFATADLAGAYAAFTTAAEICRRAVDLADPPGGRDLLAAILVAHGDRAFAAGDLLPAGALAEEAGPAGADLARRVAGERRRRTGAAARAAWLRRGLWAAGLTVAAGLAGLAWYATGMAQRRREARVAEAAGLLARADGDAVARLERAYRAWGLDPTSPGRSVARSLVAGLGADALAAGDEDQALARADELAALGAAADGLRAQVARLRDERGAARRQELERRRAVLAGLAAEARGQGSKARWIETRRDEIAGWDGDELAGDLRALADHEEPSLRRLACMVLGRRADLDAGEVLLQRLDDALSPVAEAAWSAICARDEARHTAASLAWLARQPPDRADALAMALGPRQREALRAGATPFGLLLLGDPAAAVARGETSTDPAERALAARLALYALADPARAAAIAAALRRDVPGEWWGWALGLDLAVQHGDPVGLLDLAVAATSHLPPRDIQRLGPWRAWALLELKRKDEARAAIEPLLDLKEDDPCASMLSVATGRLGLSLRVFGLMGLVNDRHPMRSTGAWSDPDLPSHRPAALRLLALPGSQRALREMVERLLDAGRPAAAAIWVARYQRHPLEAWIGRVLAGRVAIATGDLATAARVLGDQRDEERRLALRVARRRGDDRRYATLASTAGPDRPPFEAESAQGCIEAGAAHLAVERLINATWPLDLRRRVLDRLLLGIPALRERGWPGCTGHALAWQLAHEVVLLAERGAPGDRERVRDLVRLALHHAGEPARPEGLTRLLAALVEGEAGGLRAGALAALGDPVTPSWLRARCQVWATLDPAAPIPWPLVPPPLPAAATFIDWPQRRPLPDLHLDEADLIRLRELLRQHLVELPPPVKALPGLTLAGQDAAWTAWSSQAEKMAFLDGITCPPLAARPDLAAWIAGLPEVPP